MASLNSTVSTLKKNPSRLNRLVKAAKLLIVPPHQLTSGKPKALMEKAIQKLKAKRGLNGVVGEGAGPFSDRAMQKKAESQDVVPAAILGGTGAVAGHFLGTQLQEHKRIVKGYERSTRRLNDPRFTMKDVYKHDDKFERRGAKTVRGAGRRGAAIGALAGAATGAAISYVGKKLAKNKHTEDNMNHTKQAGLPAVSGSKALATLAKKKFSTKAKIAAGVAGAAAAGAAGYATHKKMTKKAGLPAVSGGQLATLAKRKFSTKAKIAAGVAGAAAAGGAYAATRKKDLTKEAGVPAVRGPEFLGKGPIPKGAKDVSPRAVLKGKIIKGGKIAAGVAAAGGLAYAAKKRLEKSAAEKLTHKGETYRRGTIGSAAGKTAATLGAVGAALGSRMGVPGAIAGGLSGAASGAMYGGAYGLIRSGLRAQDGEKSLSPAKFDRLKHRKG